MKQNSIKKNITYRIIYCSDLNFSYKPQIFSRFVNQLVIIAVVQTN